MENKSMIIPTEINTDKIKQIQEQTSIKASLFNLYFIVKF